MRNKKMISVKSIITVILLIVAIVFVMLPAEASAASKYIKTDDFINAIVDELKLPVEKNTNESYISTAAAAGLIKDGEIKSYSDYLTRTDAALLLNRADEYLYGDTLDPDLINLALEKRISDIKSIQASKRTDVVKCYLKGFIKGYSNGDYATDREFRGDKKITRSGALGCIKLIRNKSLRASISPDGQLIRTTNLPKNSDLFPYILASYPNKYYEWELKYQTISRLNPDKKMKSLFDYAAPVDIDNIKDDSYSDFGFLRKERINEWVENARKHLELVFNVDYRTIDDKWIEDVLKTNYQYGTDYEWFPRKKIDNYIKKMMPNKTIVEYKKIAIDGSTLYYYNHSFYMRVYVKYRIISSEDVSIPDGNTPLSKWSYDKILLNNGYADIGGFSLGDWKEGYYNIQLDDYNSTGNIGVLCVDFDPGREIVQ
ncbi:hypothetical protein I5677_16765 [Mobilitalea sibirica]|uniref:SLH domain-containing protein n=1 Tax=Mobilitalea sibirica TaxID=1462919 RepID=A0A8J7KUJ3_9FIRM|nr:hypothetical protein [Mobilitalea sibirica]MBH1942546.1 hypothetical protein [Mobilitalea sibirica]